MVGSEQFDALVKMAKPHRKNERACVVAQPQDVQVDEIEDKHHILIRF